ncbi:MAG: hypothetical protein SAK29_34810 [Scytonema sp. PMC 1069.18]|nr:hypothetical protein [Scytonema sp. PMC 1069.18]MEC4886464.1 hypothetical protein [Scytonema sp. PMC 1070.18]
MILASSWAGMSGMMVGSGTTRLKVVGLSQSGIRFLSRWMARSLSFVIADGRSYLSGDEHTMDMAEFFILRKYRRQGIGYRVASFIFDLFPSKWEVRQLGLNADAQTFWRKVINRYTNNQFYEISWNKERSSGVAQLFNNTIATSKTRYV